MSLASPAASAVAGDTIELTDDSTNSSASIVPARGAIVTRFCARGRELLYLDEATLRDPTKNVRGGIPVLFPSPGKLEGDRFARGGRSGAMKQHGFARDRAWTVRAVEALDGAAQATLILEDDDATRAMFPWRFGVTAIFRLERATLTITMTVENRDDAPMPFAFGFHPYFVVADKAGARIATRATRAFDNVTKQVVPFRGFDLTGGEVDLHLIDHGRTDSALTFADSARLDLRGSSDFTRWVVWTLPGKDFVCVEPWTSPANALNSGESVIDLAPGATRKLSLSIDYVA